MNIKQARLVIRQLTKQHHVRLDAMYSIKNGVHIQVAKNELTPEGKKKAYEISKRLGSLWSMDKDCEFAELRKADQTIERYQACMETIRLALVALGFTKIGYTYDGPGYGHYDGRFMFDFEDIDAVDLSTYRSTTPGVAGKSDKLHGGFCFK